MVRFRSLIRAGIFSLEGKSFVQAFNVANKFYWEFPIDLGWDENNKLYFASDKSTVMDRKKTARITFARKERAFVYRFGVLDRLNKLGEIYSVDKCELTEEDVVIDCGANVGELSALISARFGSSVIAIEPEKNESKCIGFNSSTLKTVINKGLWKESCTLNLYSKNKSADSSFIESSDYDEVISLPVITLDELFSTNNLKQVQLLKLEAEGAEPEILLGAVSSLQKISYISADLGPERGVSEETTIVEVCNILFSNGFELLSVSPRRHIYLFKNKIKGK